MDKTDRLRDYGLAFLLYEQGLGICGYELIRELFIFIKLILNSYLYREKREKDGHDGFEVFFGKNEKKLVKTCLFQNKYLSLQRSLVVKDHRQT